MKSKISNKKHDNLNFTFVKNQKKNKEYYYLNQKKLIVEYFKSNILAKELNNVENNKYKVEFKIFYHINFTSPK
uniref:Uncharacterized protein n=1 Tax=Strongyloides papillosus TaxID=174720 RepID=A0A0N5C819_STREA